MKLLVASALALVGCTDNSQYYDPGGYGPQPINTSSSCTADSQCGSGNVCARDGACYPASEVRGAVVLWTLQGQPASTMTCASSPDLQLDFLDTTGRPGFGFAPVPCAEGRFSIDKLPTFYVGAQLGTTAAPGAVGGSISPSTNQVTLNLPY